MDNPYIEGRTVAEIAASVERAIRDGRVGEGARLPPVREVADRLGVNRNTVATAYARLRDAGLITGSGRQGSIVCSIPAVDAYRPPIPSRARDLASGNVDPALLPDLTPHLAALALPPGGYEMAEDDPGLVGFARRAFRQDGIPAEAVAVVSGAMDGLERALRTHVRPGDTVAVEDPGYVSALLLIRALGLRAAPVPTDGEGMLPAPLEGALAAGARAVLLTPRAQNPTGACLSAERAARIAAVLNRHRGALLIEDDHAGPVAGAEAMTAAPPDGQARPWLVVRSVSKFLGPDLRVAVAAGDALTLARLRNHQALGPRWVSHLLQRLVGRVWTAPETAALVGRAAVRYAERRDGLLTALERRGIRAMGASGLHVWVPVQREAEVVQGMLARGWAVQAGEVFRLRSGPGIRIGIAGLAREEGETVAAALTEVLNPPRSIYA
ncbi:aminotransferase class I/II-fold pyridoxal phosphate-dependent enzyme [Azospirillum thermophilum]|uniref:GntR family transcriptional regulator n=1 Tax=Azospirillum thermophilum TaxID=2202148 RepID=A0A2S2CT17_9PROT|nr:aminotransferase class I/II-fold pyridoxal phosphate-dependent enzyme [Azospirillum thermophilum]AWK87609.1 GntR family transcriptional regulator [Azospirillum thermophilum]